MENINNTFFWVHSLFKGASVKVSDVNAEIVISISVMVVSGLIVDFECRVLYQILALIGCGGV